MTPEDFVKAVYPSAYIRCLPGGRVYVARKTQWGREALSSITHSETDAWTDAQSRLPIAVK
jgi:hypothetical protein